MARKVCVVTGATGGIGVHLAADVLMQGYDIVLHGRSQEGVDKLKAQLSVSYPGANITAIGCDLDSAQAAWNLVSRINAVAPSIDLVINNAGVLLDGMHTSPDGLDMHTQINLIAPFIIMKGLRGNVQKTSGTIINVSSGAALRAKTLSLDALKTPSPASNLLGIYAQSKLALAVVTRTLAADYSKDGITLVACDPGPTKTPMTSGRGMPGFLKLVRPFIYASPATGAQNILDGANDAINTHHSGAFYSKGRRMTLPTFATNRSVSDEIMSFCTLWASRCVQDDQQNLSKEKLGESQ